MFAPHYFGAMRSLPVRRLALALLLVVAVVPSGCVSEKGPRPRPKKASASAGHGPISEVNLLTVPVALNLDSSPGTDGISVKVFLNAKGNSKPVAAVSGSLEIVMFEGVPKWGSEDPKPRKTWSFTAAELKSALFQSRIGAGYQFVLKWGVDRPNSNKVSVVARYLSENGDRVLSMPSVITVIDM